MSLVQEFNDYRSRMNELILAQHNLPLKRFFSLDHQMYQEGALTVKTKELLGLVASMVLRCDDSSNTIWENLMSLVSIPKRFMRFLQLQTWWEGRSASRIQGGRPSIGKSWSKIKKLNKKSPNLHSCKFRLFRLRSQNKKTTIFINRLIEINNIVIQVNLKMKINRKGV
ncbi:MAG TPA: carboxymuconolactone decarboxylase family protein [Saprospiraceae bacterium]|nr:carboxymuconolactone decarboxylase family protein [Saprospiraceae bacterium]